MWPGSILMRRSVVKKLKRQLVRASLAATHAIRGEVYPEARFVLDSPAGGTFAHHPDNPDSKPYAHAQHQAQFEALGHAGWSRR